LLIWSAITLLAAIAVNLFAGHGTPAAYALLGSSVTCSTACAWLRDK
jgi:hypothetical protein